MIALIAMLLALVGAPAHTTATCAPVYSMYRVFGYTNLQTDEVTLDAPSVCQGLTWLADTPQQRVQLQQQHPGVDLVVEAAVGVLVTLHEGTHAALDSRDECLVENTALWKVWPVLFKYFKNPTQRLSAVKAVDNMDTNFRFQNGCV